MLITYEPRTVYVSPKSDFVSVLPLSGQALSFGPPWSNTPIKVSLVRSAVQTYFEQLRSDNEMPKDLWKPVEHYKRYCFSKQFGVESQEGGNLGRGTFPWYQSGRYNSNYGGQAGVDTVPSLISNFTSPWQGAFALYVPRTDGGFVPPPPDLDKLITLSLQTMLPRIKAELSLINSVIELKDLSRVGPTIRRIHDTVRNLVGRIRTAPLRSSRHLYTKSNSTFSRIRKSFKASWGPTLKEVTNTSADSFLNVEFGIMPLLSDICGLTTALSTVEKSVTTLIERSGRRQVRRFRKTFPGVAFGNAVSVANHSVIDGNTYFGNYVPDPCFVFGGHAMQLQVRREVTTEPYEFHSQMEYNYSFTPFQIEHAQLLGLLDSLGVNLNPAIIWNALPWSFVVDWLVGVSRWLDNRATLNLEPTINITRFAWSWKVTRKITSTFKSYQVPPVGCKPILTTDLPDVYEEAYRRDVGIPTNNSLITSGLSRKEITLGVALAITRQKRRPTR